MSQMEHHAIETTPTPPAESNLFGEVRTIGKKVDELETADTAILAGIEILNGKLDAILVKLAAIEARDIRIEQEVSPPGAVRLDLILGKTVPQ